MMNDTTPAISVIVPTHNRRSSLRRTLDALRMQSYPLHQVEVLVVADGCTDDTLEMLRNYTALFTLRILQQSGLGAATARNNGASQARGRLLLFLDDDIEPMPGLIAAHVAAHKNRPDHVVIGPYPPLPQAHIGFFRLHLRHWWESKFNALHKPGHRFSYQDLLSGNLSLSAKLFAHIGGFNTDFRECGGEDYEFGFRLISADVPFVFAPDALGYHHEHETMTLERSFRRARREGQSDVLMGRLHPEVRVLLPLVFQQHFSTPRRRTLAQVAFHWQGVGDALAPLLRYQLDYLERLGLRRRWLRLYDHLRFYWYWRGVAEELKTRQALDDFVQEAHAHIVQLTDFPIDLRAGIEAAERRLDEARPNCARLVYSEHHVGFIPAEVGAERLRGVHLRSFLATSASIQLLKALALEGAIYDSPAIDRQSLAQSIQNVSQWYGPTTTSRMGWEQYSQWGYLDWEISKLAPKPNDEVAVFYGDLSDDAANGI